MQVSLVKPGQSFQIVTNLQSKRKTPVMMAFYQGERLFGADAESLAVRKPRYVLQDPQRLLGRNATHSSVVNYLNHTLLITDTDVNGRGGIDFVLPADALGAAGAEETDSATSLLRYSAEEVVAQLLGHAKDFTEVEAGTKVRDAVLTVPAYYTQNERVALIDAAELAGFNVLALVDENTAAGIHYGIDRVTENGTHYMMLYNMGFEATQVTLFAYDSYVHVEKGSSKNKTVGQGRVVAKAWDTALGGRHFDKALIEYCVAKFNEAHGKKLPAEYNGDLRNIASAMVKFKKNVAKAKEILSANEEYQLFVEAIVPDLDFRITLSRAVLDAASETAGLWARTTAVLQSVLDQSGVPLRDIAVVEIVGGGVRVPKVQAVLRDYIAAKAAEETKAATEAGEDVSNATVPGLAVHLNGDEAMALGAAFAAANRSAAFRVRKVGMVDTFPFAVGVRLSHLNSNNAAADAAASAGAADTGSAAESVDGDAASGSTDSAAGSAPKSWGKRSSLFRPYNPIDSVKRISFTSEHDLRAVLFYEQTSGTSTALPAGTSRVIGVFNITGIDAILADTDTRDGARTAPASLGVPKVHISFELDHNGVATVLKAEATQEEEVQVPIATPTPKPSVTPAAELDGNATANATETNSTDDAEATATPTAEPTAEATATPDASASADASASPSAEASASDDADQMPKYKLVKKTHKYPLKIAVDPPTREGALPGGGLQVQPLAAIDKSNAAAKLRKLKLADDRKRALESAKNAVEAYLYAVRDRRDAAGEELDTVTTDDQREAISAALLDTDDWLYGDGATADLDTYKKKLKEIQAIIEPCFARLEEQRVRPTAITEARTQIEAMRTIVNAWSTTHPQVS